MVAAQGTVFARGWGDPGGFRWLYAERVVRPLEAVLLVILAVVVVTAVGRLSGLTLNSCKALV